MTNVGNTGISPGYPFSREYPSTAPADMGFQGWTFDPAITSNVILLSTVAAAGVSATIVIPVAQAFTVARGVSLILTTPGATLTASQNLVAVYQGNATVGIPLVGTSADQSATWVGATGLITAGGGTLVGQVVYPPFVTVALWFNGTTAPTFQRGVQSPGLNGLGAPFRYGTAGSGLTTAAPATLGAVTSGQYAIWAAIS